MDDDCSDGGGSKAFETSVKFYQKTRSNNPERSYLCMFYCCSLYHICIIPLFYF
jgi:hypothetical protein